MLSGCFIWGRMLPAWSMCKFLLSFLEIFLFLGLIPVRTLTEKHPSGIPQHGNWKHAAATLWKMVALSCWGPLQMFTRPQLVWWLKRYVRPSLPWWDPEVKKPGNPLNNFKICKEDVWMLYRNNWWCLCHPHGVPGGWSTSAAEAFKDILGKFLTQAMIKHLLHSGMVECTASPACLARIPLFFPPRLFLHCAFQLLLFHTKKRERED